MKILATFLISAIAFQTLALAEYNLPDKSSFKESVGNGTRVFDCTYRGSDRREGCLGI
ncbi:MAG: hypothetical protein KME38_04595 [Spirirestis rafaelensis WJT71-NPBG6]|nr:hypothetical protein [Spirirestis rafaelensis WJT71-NPBG6]